MNREGLNEAELFILHPENIALELSRESEKERYDPCKRGEWRIRVLEVKTSTPHQDPNHDLLLREETDDPPGVVPIDIATVVAEATLGPRLETLRAILLGPGENDQPTLKELRPLGFELEASAVAVKLPGRVLYSLTAERFLPENLKDTLSPLRYKALHVACVVAVLLLELELEGEGGVHSASLCSFTAPRGARGASSEGVIRV